MKAKIRGTEIYFDIAGMQLQPVKQTAIEKPILFMLHGGPGGDHFRYKQHSLELQEVAQLVFIDHRGCGRSKKTQRNEYTLENNIEDIEALRQYLGLDKICMLGTSYGGMVAQGYAIRYPKNLTKLILVATAPSYRCMETAKKILHARGTPEQIAISENLWNGTFKSPKQVQEFFNQMEAFYSTQKSPKKTANQYQTIWSHEAINEGFAGFLRTFDFIPQLKKIRCPTLVLAGKNDWICSAEESKIIAQHIPQAELKIFKNCGHMIAIDAHAKYIHAVKKFMKQS